MNIVDRMLTALLAALILPSCVACAQEWTFTQPDARDQIALMPHHAPVANPGLLNQPPAFPTWQQPVWQQPNPQPPPAMFDERLAWNQQPGSAQPPVSNQPLDPNQASWATPPATDYTCDPEDRVRSMFVERWSEICSDHGNYYSGATLRDLALAVTIAAPFANTSWDADLQNWYQRDVRSSGTDRCADFWKTFGEGQIFIPTFIALGVAGSFFEEQSPMGTAGEFGTRVTRGYLVGGPPMLVLQFALGGSRPDEARHGSQWRPFDDTNAVSGHAFMGAVPFITAAQMCDNRWAKGALYFCSTLTGWSRVNDHDHYPTQAVLGWWMAYLACRAVNQTELEDRCVSFTPLITPEMTGVGMVVRR